MLTISEETTDVYWALRSGASVYVLKKREVSADVIKSVHRGFFTILASLTERFVNNLQSSDSAEVNPQEREILAHIARGETNREIASRLHVSERIVNRWVEDIYSKLHLADRLDAAVYTTRRSLEKKTDLSGTRKAHEGQKLARLTSGDGPTALPRCLEGRDAFGSIVESTAGTDRIRTGGVDSEITRPTAGEVADVI